jgi:hypothetical protein
MDEIAAGALLGPKIWRSNRASDPKPAASKRQPAKRAAGKAKRAASKAKRAG